MDAEAPDITVWFNPSYLVERPIVIRGERAVVARPPERLLELLDR